MNNKMFSRSRKEPDVKNKRLRNYRAVKRAFDMAGSVLLMAVSAPAVLTAAAAIKAETPGNVIFVHNRIGENGKKIRVYKFRSMHSGAENLEASLNDDQLEAFYREYKLKDDPRVTKSGRFLRRSYFDEIPQLINILKGDMSLVGPRPLISDEYEIHHMRAMFGVYSIRPGVTGLAQINGRNAISWEKKFEYDVEYVDNITFIGDWKIMFQTVGKVLKRDGITSETSVTMEEFMGSESELKTYE
jgi:lipopolysaccharide/colanic/teichoic acid biosynthesis glycosyltransferase